MDLRFVLGTRGTVDDIANPHFREFLNTFIDMVTDHDIKTPDVWLWMTENIDPNAQAMAYASTNLKDEYVKMTSNYMPFNKELFNGSLRVRSWKSTLSPSSS